MHRWDCWSTRQPAEAFRDALIAAFADEEAMLALRRRVRFIHANPQVQAAAIEQSLSGRAAPAEGFALVAGRKEPSLTDDALASVCLAALDAAIDHWRHADDDTSLAQLIERAFAATSG